MNIIFVVRFIFFRYIYISISSIFSLYLLFFISYFSIFTSSLFLNSFSTIFRLSFFLLVLYHLYHDKGFLFLLAIFLYFFDSKNCYYSSFIYRYKRLKFSYFYNDPLFSFKLAFLNIFLASSWFRYRKWINICSIIKLKFITCCINTWQALHSFGWNLKLILRKYHDSNDNKFY